MVRLLTPAIALIVAGCASSTQPGAVGVQRAQLMIVSSAQINAQAASGYAQMSGAARSSGKLNTDPVLTQRVRGIATRLIAQVGVYRPDAAKWAWEVNVFDSPELNAFCMPGGKIGLYTGLIKGLDMNDAEIAAVTGHEIAHALREHSREKVSQQGLSQAVVTGIAVSGARNAGAYGALAGVGSLLFMQLPFSREMELEADVMGLELMARAGYDPRLAPSVWQKMSAKSGGGRGRAEFFSTHPHDANRIRALHEAVPKVIGLYEAAPKAR